MASCDSCGASLRPGADACDLCGTPVTDAPAPVATNDASGPTCPVCDHVSPPGSRYCNVCGAPLDAALDAAAPPPPSAPAARPPSDAGKKALLVIGIGLATVVGLYLLTIYAPRNQAPAEAPADEIGEAAPIPAGAPPLPDSLQIAADGFAAQASASGWYESGRYYLTAAFNTVQTDPTSSVRWARRAIEDFERSLALEESPGVRVALAEAATFDPSDPMRPIQELRAVLEADPGNLDATYLLAERRMMIGRVDSARVAFERVIAEAPPGSAVRERAQAALAQIDGQTP